MATVSGFSDSSPIHLTVITNSALLRDGILTVLHPHLPVALAGAGDGDTPTPLLPPPLLPHLLLLDWNIGAAIALTRIREWHRLNLSVVVIELPNDTKTLIDCIEAGARGYTLRGATAADLSETILAVLRGEAPCSPQLAAQLFSRLAHYHQHQVAATQNLLTERELEVLALLVKEYSNKAIAATLCIEVRTVKHHVHNILDKLQLHSRWEASHYAVQHGLVAAG
jgi:two-component system nitrate/nitrite response regulator NarL